MKKMRWIIPIIGVVVVIVIVGFLFASKKGNEEMKKAMELGSGGSIYYGGDFDEFEYQTGDSDEDNEKPMDKEERQKEIENLKEKAVKDAKKEISIEPEVREEVTVILEDDGNIISEDSTEEATGDVEEAEGVSESGEFEKKIPFDLNDYEHDKVIFVAETREEAEDVAKQIGGTVISYEKETAIIQISEDVDTLLQRLESQGSSLVFMRKYTIG